MSTQFTNRQWRLPNNENKDKQSNYSMYIDSTPYIKSSLSVDELNEITISLWFKTSISNQSDGVLISFPETTSATGLDISFQYSNPNEKIRFNTYTHSSNNRVEANFNYSDNNWHHLICSYNGSVHNIYIDGVLKASESASGTLKNAQNEFFIGAFNTTYPSLRADNTFFDQVCVFNYPLSDGGVSVGQTATGQIATLYGGGSAIGNPMSLSPAPVAYYPLGDQDAFNGAEYLTPNSSLKDFVFDFGGGNTGERINLSSFDLGLNSTITFWMNRPGAIQDVILGEDSYNYGYLMYADYNNIYIRIDNNYAIYNNFMDINKWYNIVIVRQGDSIEVFRNNTSLGTQTGFGTTVNTKLDTIGAKTSGASAFEGKLSNIQIFNTALPTTGSNSVETLYNNGSPLTSMSGFTSLQGWWKLDASATYDGSNWTIPDDSSNSNDGTSSGMTQANLVQSDLSFKSGYSPFALDFDAASSDYISTTASISGFSSFTISAWANAETLTTADTLVGQWRNGNTSNSAFLMYLVSNTMHFYIGSGSSAILAGGDTTLSTGQWYHFCATWDGATTKLYINGVQESTTGSASSINTTTVDLLIGAYNNSAGTGVETAKTWNGQMSNVSIWNSALTSTQVTEIYNEGVPQNLNNHSAYLNLVSWWQLGSNSSFNTNWTVLDEKGSNNGTSVNMTEADIVDGVGSYANGLSSGMGGDEVIGDAPYSTANSLSVNMDVEDRTTDTPS